MLLLEDHKAGVLTQASREREELDGLGVGRWTRREEQRRRYRTDEA